MADMSVDATTGRNFREFQAPGAPRQDGKKQLPRGVGVIANPSYGRRYLFRPDEVIVPEAELEEGLGERLGRLGAVRMEGAQTFELSDDGPRRTADSDSAALAELRIKDRDDLVKSALKAAGMVKFKIPQPPDDPQRRRMPLELPDLVDLVRGGSGHVTTADAEAAGANRGHDEGQIWNCWPNHVLTVQDYPEWGPGGPVDPLPDFPIPRNPGSAGSGVTVAVIDTGARKNHAWLKDNVRYRGPIDEEILDTDENNVLDIAGGHGTFVAGVIRQLAPGADIVVRGAAHSNGTVEDGVVAGSLLTLLSEDRIDIVNLSLGGYTHLNEGNGLPLTTAALRRLRVKWPRLVVVAAAGNDNRSDPFFPAARCNVIGVGALDRQGRKACFSNCGSWVDAWALGVEVESSFVGPDIHIPDGGGSGTEGARWSGTSFAAPRIAGALAAAMSPGGHA